MGIQTIKDYIKQEKGEVLGILQPLKRVIQEEATAAN